MEGVVIPRKQEFERKVSVLRELGFRQVQIIADHDWTQTKGFEGGKRTLSSFDYLRVILGKGYAQEAERMLSLFYPIVLHGTQPEREAAAYQWRQDVLKVARGYGLNRSQLTLDIMGHAPFREGVDELHALCDMYHVPVTIVSAGLGQVVRVHLDAIGRDYPVLSNFFTFDERGVVNGYVAPEIDITNKHHILEKTGYLEKLLHRPGVVLLGDSLDDALIADTLPKGFIELKIGFLNYRGAEGKKRLPAYAQAFDAVVVDDGPMHPVVDVLEEFIR